MNLWVYMWEPRTSALGPFLRFALWTQGCDKRCKGCISPDSRLMEDGELLPVKTLTEQILKNNETEGITISGGEPFLQAKALCELIETVRNHRDFGVILYTGFTLPELNAMNDASVDRLLAFCDLLIDGPYIEELNDGKSLRGSCNQRVIPLSGRYEGYLDMYGIQGRKVELLLKNCNTRVIGIPPKDVSGKLGKNQEE